LIQCFSNLIENGLKFCRPGEPAQVTVSTEHHGAHVRIQVADRGIGIDPRDQERIFGLFERVDGRAAGTGVGLAIVKKAAERMKGHVELKSARGRGATFWIELEAASS
jgi:signal transduction histidine kinase